MGTIADSITIKVGHGIMTIPRDIEKIKKLKITSKKNKNLEERTDTTTQ